MCVCVCVCVCAHTCTYWSCPTLLKPRGLQPSRLPSPWNAPGKNAGVGCHFLLQGIFPTQGSNPPLSCLLPWQVDSLSLHHLGNLRISDSAANLGSRHCDLLFILSGLQPVLRLGGGEEREKRTAKGWVWGPSCRAWDPSWHRAAGTATSGRSPHPGASRGTAASLERALKSINQRRSQLRAFASWGTEALGHQKFLVLRQKERELRACSAITDRRLSPLGTKTPPPTSGPCLHLEVPSCGLVPPPDPFKM